MKKILRFIKKQCSAYQEPAPPMNALETRLHMELAKARAEVKRLQAVVEAARRYLVKKAGWHDNWGQLDELKKALAALKGGEDAKA